MVEAGHLPATVQPRVVIVGSGKQKDSPTAGSVSPEAWGGSVGRNETR